MPSPEVAFGGEAVQPLCPPFTFRLEPDERDFDASVAPWRLSRDQLLSSLLLREAEQVQPDTMQAIFQEDFAALKRQAAVDKLRFSEALQGPIREHVLSDGVLGKIERQLASSSAEIELSAL